MTDSGPSAAHLRAQSAALARRVRERRERRRWSQDDLAQRMRRAGLPGVSQVTVSRIEQQTRDVRLVEVLALARIFEEPLGALVRAEDDFEGVVAARESVDVVMRALVQIEELAIAVGRWRAEARAALDTLQAMQATAYRFPPDLETELFQVTNQIEVLLEQDLRAVVTEAEEHGRRTAAAASDEEPHVIEAGALRIHWAPPREESEGAEDGEHPEAP